MTRVSSSLKTLVAAGLAGAVFGIGLAVSRMTDPTVVLGFLDVSGDFDVRLLCVMAGAVLTTLLGFPLVLRRARPWFEERFRLPVTRVIDTPLVLGAVLFGLGWGLSGYCPGPVLVSAAAGVPTAIAFLAAMLIGAGLHGLWSRLTRRVLPP